MTINKDEAIKLSREAVNASGFEWYHGMLNYNHWIFLYFFNNHSNKNIETVCLSRSEELSGYTENTKDEFLEDVATNDEWLPDFTDELTCLAVLLMVRKKHGVNTRAERCPYTKSWFLVFDGEGDIRRPLGYNTEIAALVAALKMDK